MNKLTLSLFGLLLITYSSKLNAQTPANDANWILNTAKSDEFPTTSLDLSKWLKLNGNGANGGYNWGGNSNFKPANTKKV